MFEIVDVLDSESRQVLFGVVMDVYRAERREVAPADLLASILRAPSLSSELSAAGADIPGLLASLSAPPIGTGTAERLQRIVSESENMEEASEDPESALGLPQGAGFVGLPLSAEARESFAQMRQSFGQAPSESVAPRQVLAVLLSSNSALAELAAKYGVRLP